MKLVQCPNHHYYDADKYDQCPLCYPGTQEKNFDGTIQYNPNEQAQTFNQDTVVQDNEPVKEEAPTLQDVINDVSTTVSEDDKTIPLNAYRSEDNAIERGFIVGWLVGLNGANKGLSFNLYVGKNFIGRSPDSDVCIKEDRTVARNKHAIVIYDPKSKDFIAIPGESRELYYLNDQLVLSQIKMKANDVLQLGKTKLLFVPLCNDQFDWDQYQD